MAGDPIPPQVRQFVTDRIHSTAELELLLLLRGDGDVSSAGRGWSARRAGEELRMPVAWAAGQLAAMQATGLLSLQHGPDGGEPAYCYAPGADAARLVDQLAEAYRHRKTRVVALIYAAESSGATSFADAFRMRRRP